MKIAGNPVGTTMPRTNWEQTNPAKADYLKGREIIDERITNAQNAADNAQTAADNAQTAADNAQTAADNAKGTADAALPKSGGDMTGNIAMGGKKVTGLADPTEDGDAVRKKYVHDYVDGKRKVFTATLTVNDWVGDAAPFTQTIGIEGILATDMPHYSAVYSESQDTRLAQKEAFALVDDLDTADGSVTFTCFEDKPDVNIPIQMEVNR